MFQFENIISSKLHHTHFLECNSTFVCNIVVMISHVYDHLWPYSPSDAIGAFDLRLDTNALKSHLRDRHKSWFKSYSQRTETYVSRDCNHDLNLMYQIYHFSLVSATSFHLYQLWCHYETNIVLSVIREHAFVVIALNHWRIYFNLIVSVCLGIRHHQANMNHDLPGDSDTHID